MKKVAALAASLVAVAGLGMAVAPVATAVETAPPNAIVSEGNGVAVLIGYGADKSVNLSWRPAKAYEKTDMLYQLQRGDGVMLESRTGASSFTDKNLDPNTTYTYILTSFESTTKQVKVTKGPQKGQTVNKTLVKRLGTNQVSVTTLPSMVVALRATGASRDSVSVAWQPPQYSANPVTYSVYSGGNLQAYGLTDLGYTMTGLSADTSYNIKVVVVNAAGEARDNATVTIKTAK